MPCDKYKALLDSARESRKHANHLRVNGPFAGKRKMQRMIADEQKAGVSAQSAAFLHHESCPECQKDKT